MMRRLTSPFAAVAILALFWLLLIATAWNKSVTYDELAHATGGYTYWKFNDYRINPENGNLPQRIAALPLLGYPFPITSENWLTPSEWNLGDEWFHRMGIDVQALLRRGRAAAALQAVALAALIWGISRRIFGPVGSLVSLLVCVLNPTILANGSLMTSDTAAALFFLAAVWTWWLVLERITAVRVATSALATAGLFLSKSSAVLIVPILLALTIVRLFDRRDPESGRRRFLPLIAAAGIQFIVCYVAIWGFYGFRYAAYAPDQPSAAGSSLWAGVPHEPSVADLIEGMDLPESALQRARELVVERSAPLYGWGAGSESALVQMQSEGILSAGQVAMIQQGRTEPYHDAPTRTIEFLSRHHVLPESYLVGSLYAWRFSQMRKAFLDGEYYYIGRSYFFPYTFAVKTPIAFFGLLLLAGLGWVSRRRQDLIPLVVLFAFYGAALLGSRLNIGHRHMLTLYPPLFIFAGAAGVWLETAAAGTTGRWTRLAGQGTVLLIGVQAVEMAWRFPDYLAYFNGVISPARAYRHFIDSSLDWGQDLPGVGSYIAAHADGKPFLLSYFGNGDPRTYGIDAVFLPSTPGRFRTDRTPVVFEPVSSATPSAGEIDALKRRYPQHAYVGVTPLGGKQFAVFFLPPKAWKLPAGTYFISASNLQAKYGVLEEEVYQKLRVIAQAYIAPSSPEEAAIMRQYTVEQMRDILNNFEAVRQQRLQAFLRAYTPDDQIGNSILVFKVSEADLDRALDGPAPVGVKYLEKTVGGGP